MPESSGKETRMLSRRHTMAAMGGLLAGAGFPCAFAQVNKRINLLVGFPAGGAPDTAARAVAEGLRSQGVTAMVDNKAGAGGRLAIDALLAAPPDGQTLMLMPSGNATIYPHIYQKLRYRGPGDFAPLASVCEFSFAFAVNPALPVRTVADYVSWAKAHPNDSAFGTPGAGTAMHFLGVQFAELGKFEMRHVPYKGGAPALTDVMGGIIPAVFTTLPNLIRAHQAGKVRILAHSGDQRVNAVKEVPTFVEAGLAALTMQDRFLVVAHAKTPLQRQQELSQAVVSAASNPAVRAILANAEYQTIVIPRDRLIPKLNAEFERWAKVVAATGYRSED